MNSYARTHLSDDTLLHSLVTNTGKAREVTADQIADIGEVEARGLCSSRLLRRGRPRSLWPPALRDCPNYRQR
jgi:hypothetical protein